MRITRTAQRHGIEEADIRHAIGNAIRVYRYQGDHELTLFIGPAFDGTLPEVGVVSDDDGARAVRAITARTKYRE